MGHVPRARDKVEGSPLGHLPGTPVSPNKPSPGGGYEQHSGNERAGERERYTSEARAASANGVSPTDKPKPQLYAQGAKPGYGGHVPQAREIFGQSVYSRE